MERWADGRAGTAAPAAPALPAKAARLANAIREDFRGILIQGRWLLVAAQTVVSIALIVEMPLNRATLAMLALLGVYNLLSLIAVYRVSLRPWLLLCALAGDLLLTGAAAWQTGGVHSPFLGQYFLIIFAGALLYERRGGLIVGLAAAITASLLAGLTPPGQPARADAFRALANLVPYYLLSGGFAGVLVRRIRNLLRSDYSLRLRAESAQRELTMARSMQQAALPEVPPEWPGLDCAVVNRYAGEVGGDFLIFLPPREGEAAARHDGPGFGIVIGDVSGKGIPAALASTSIAHLLPWLHPLEDPRRALQQLNEDLLDRLPETSYATLIFAELPSEGDRLRLWTAGHPPAIHYRASEGRASVIETSAFPLGMFPGWKEPPVTLPWAAGDTLLLYTDGLSETRHAATGEQFGAERLADLVTEHCRESAAEIVDAILRAALAWGSPADDLTLVACKRKPRAATP